MSSVVLIPLYLSSMPLLRSMSEAFSLKTLNIKLDLPAPRSALAWLLSNLDLPTVFITLSMYILVKPVNTVPNSVLASPFIGILKVPLFIPIKLCNSVIEAEDILPVNSGFSLYTSVWVVLPRLRPFGLDIPGTAPSTFS